MRKPLTGAILLAAGVLVAAAASPTGGDPHGFTVHEWGTFTSVAGEDGRAVPWRPLSGPPDLPGFVRRSGIDGKGRLTATVRMETPVLYFYGAHESVADVTVGFRQGLITEYFPKAFVRAARPGSVDLNRPALGHTIAWRDVRIQPAAPPVFPTDGHANHYYAARDTDAAPLLVGRDRERFLFYRGVGNFPLPLTAVVAANGAVRVANAGRERIAAGVLFENRGGRIAWRMFRGVKGEVKLTPDTTGAGVAAVGAQLERILIEEGLYPKEAAAMVKTWSETWFEEGTRIFYVVPRLVVDEILPLEIRPDPQAIERVFVGRVELVTPQSLTDLSDALRTRDRARLARLGRFLQPFADRLLPRVPAADRAQYEAIIERVSRDLERLAASPAAEY